MTAIDRFTRAEREVYRLSRQIEVALDGEKAWRGLTAPQAMIIARMGDDSLSITAMQHRCYSGANITYNIKVLSDRGLISMTQDPDDARSKRVVLTDLGKRLREMTLGLVSADDYFAEERSAA